MKKNLLSKKQKYVYERQFLPLLEDIFTLKTWKKEDLVVNQSSIADYLSIDRRAVGDFLTQAEKDGLIEFDRSVRKIDDKTVTFAMRRYKLPIIESNSFYTKIQEHINTYMEWVPDYKERQSMYSKFMAFVSKETEAKTEKEEKAKSYLETYDWTSDLIMSINEERPQDLKSSYLEHGKLRESNFLCTTLNPEKDHDCKLFTNDLMYRYIKLTEFFGTSDFVELDTNASIYRLSYNLNHDELLSHNVDVYTEFWKIAGFDGQLDKISRDYLKTICMPIFMSNGSKNGYNASLVARQPVDLTRSEDNRRLILKYFQQKTGLLPREFLDKLTEAMYKFIGTDHFLEAEIFIHESNLHLLILDQCKQKGIQAINVYDGFYFKKGDMDLDGYDKLYDYCTDLLKRLEKTQ